MSVKYWPYFSYSISQSKLIKKYECLTTCYVSHITHKTREVSVSSCLGYQNCHRSGPNTVPAQTAECHVIFIVSIRFSIENSGGDGFDQFFINVSSFWCIICPYSLIRSYFLTKKYWWQYITTVTTYPLSLVPLHK